MWHTKAYFNCPDSVEIILTVLELSGQYIKTGQTVLTPSGQYWHLSPVSKLSGCCPGSVKIIGAVLKLIGQYWPQPERLQLSGHHWNHPGSFETVQTVLKLSGQNINLLASIETTAIKVIRTVLKLSGKCWSWSQCKISYQIFPASPCTIAHCLLLWTWQPS